MAIATMCATTEAAVRVGAGRPADERLRAYVRVFLQRVVGQTRDYWIHQLMLREMGDPTPTIDDIVDQVIRPRLRYLRDVVGELLALPPAHDDVMRCVSSVQAQCHAAIPNPLSHRLAVGRPAVSNGVDHHDDRGEADRLADHITNVSLAGIERMRARGQDLRG